MRLTRIHVRGYKRLVDASCNVDGRLIALVGPNESGKSSVLEALAWLSDVESGGLDGPSRSRSLPSLSDTTHVVEVRFALGDEDRAILSDLATDDVAQTFTALRLADGTCQWILEPRLHTRREPLDEALAALDRLEQDFPGLMATDGEEEGHEDLAEVVRLGLRNPDGPDRSSMAAAGAELHAWLGSLATADTTTVRVGRALRRTAAALAAALPFLDGPAPNEEAGGRLWARRPTFLLFGERDRVLETQYNLDDAALYANTPPALVNLLALGNTDVQLINEVRRTGEVTRISSFVKKVNKVLAERLKPTWRQSELTVAIAIRGPMLELLVDEVNGDSVTAIHERSDGLKTFMALVCFLARHRGDVPPVLMLDEAETHLHYDAQADLIDVLINHVEASSVIYTTHSPGCLPPDLGTGIRLVAPSRDEGVSVLRNDFWASNEPGFSPLLFAMGAGAAAFSVCRRAVLAEGPSDMILLPTLIRLATCVDELGYQVAPGLSTLRTDDLTNAEVAARVAYLADGDAAGDDYRDALLEAGVDPGRVFRLPSGWAIEDLIAPGCYLRAVTAHMREAGWEGEALEVAALEGPGPIAARLEGWCATWDVPVPGKTAIASRLVREPSEIELASGAASCLVTLHRDLLRALG